MRNLVNNTNVELLTNYELTEINGGDIFGIQFSYYESFLTFTGGLIYGALEGFIDASEHY